MPTFPRCNKFSRTESCPLSNDIRSVLSRRAKQPRYVCVCTSRCSAHDFFFHSSGHLFMSKLPRCAYQLSTIYLLCKRLHPTWPWRNPIPLLALKIRRSYRDSIPIHSTLIAHHPNLLSSPHKPQSPPRQQQRLREHGERMMHLSRHCRQALIRLGAYHLSLLSCALTVSYASLLAQIRNQRRPLLPRIYSPG